MLRQVLISRNNAFLYQRNFGNALSIEDITSVFTKIKGEIQRGETEPLNSHDFFRYRVTFNYLAKYDVMHIFICDLSDEYPRIKSQMEKTMKEFMDTFGSLLDGEITKDDMEIFTPVIEKAHKNLRPKISLVGFSGVGKTTITRLITAQDIPMEHVPTITGDIGTIKIGKLHFSLWDFAGQEQFSFLWNKFIQGSDGVLLITDSSLENCEKSKYFIDLIKSETPYAHVAVIGNKQDLPEAITVQDIERHLGMKVYPMIAVDKNNRQKMINIIANILDIATEDSDLFRPLADRDKMLKQAEAAEKIGDLAAACSLYEKLVDTNLKLGDDSLSRECEEKVLKLKKKVGSSPAGAPIPVAPTPVAPTPVAPTTIQPVVTAPSPSTLAPSGQSETQVPLKPTADKANELIKDFKVRVASVVQKMADLELLNISGELSDVDFQLKIERLVQLKKKLEQQLVELQK